MPSARSGPGGLGRANAVLEAADGVSLLAGPAIAGVTVARLGAAWGLAVNAVSFVVSGLLLRLFCPGSIHPHQPRRLPRTSQGSTPGITHRARFGGNWSSRCAWF